jgi:hypothetical protein
MTKLELDGMEKILTIISKINLKQMTWVMWYNNKKKVYNTTTV